MPEGAEDHDTGARSHLLTVRSSTHNDRRR